MGLGFMEIVIIGVMALVLLGPSRLPAMMRQIAKFYVQLRRTSNEFKSAFDHVVEEAEQELGVLKPGHWQSDTLKVTSPVSSIVNDLEKSVASEVALITRTEQPFDWSEPTKNQSKS
jgi:Tat protein translocase TatB subunit